MTLLATFILLLFLGASHGQDMPADAAMPVSVTEGTLKAKIAEVENAVGIQEESKTKLLELYRKALSNLKQASANAEAAERFRRAAETAPAEIQSIREAMAKDAETRPEDTLDVDPSIRLRQLEQLLQLEKADLAALEAKWANIEKRLGEETERPGLIRKRLSEAREQQQEVIAQRRLATKTDETSAVAEARRWELETRSGALSTEIQMLQSELLSRPMRLDLLKAQREQAATSVHRIRERLALLETWASDKRTEEAARVRAAAEATRRELEGKNPYLGHLADENLALADELAQLTSRMDELAQLTAQTEKLAREVESRFERAKDAFEVGGLTQELAHIVLHQHQSLPSLRAQRRISKERDEQAAEISVSRLRHQEEHALLRDPDAYLVETLGEEISDETSELRAQLSELARTRKGLLDTAIEAEEAYLQRLEELEAAQRRLLDVVMDYNAFVDEHLLWVRSTSVLQLDKLAIDFEDLWQFLSPDGWQEVGQTLAYQATHSPIFALLVVALAVLLGVRGRLIAALRGLRPKLGKPTTDRFGYTLYALVITLVAAAPWPLFMAVTGWQLKASPVTTDFSSAVGMSLVAVANHFYHLRALRFACVPDGLAAAHFRWPEASLRLLRTELDRLTWIFVPAALGAVLAARLDPLDLNWFVWRLFFLVAVGALAIAFYRLLHPDRGILAGYLRDRRRRNLKNFIWFGYLLAVASPVGLGVLSLLGYRNNAGASTELLLETVWLAATLAFTSALAERWLLVSRRRLAYKAAMERRESEEKEQRPESERRGGEGNSPHQHEETDVDVMALSDTSRKLINTGILLYGLVGLWLIWSDVFPAFQVLDEVILWHYSVTLDGESQVLPVTLGSVGLALVYSVVTVLLAKQFPAALEILLLQYSRVSAGGRYTITTLTNYAIVTTGLVLVFKTLGADWSQLQWLVAALGVGIGFGLQEIVANFISGIIILFERPIRIGDVVTVGDTDGVVTRIRSRATTIRNWDGKELLVPNKEFITGSLLNWSLSDPATRIMLSVGIAYGSDVRQAMRLLEDAARENSSVLDEPAPLVIFETFGDNALGLILRCFVDSVDVRYTTVSALNEAINEKFNAAGLVIAFPQRDLHLDTVRPLQVELRRVDEQSGE
jgi:potassium efflux system protein